MGTVVDSPCAVIRLKTKQVPLLYDDGSVIIVNKPAGIVVCDAAAGDTDLVTALAAKLPGAPQARLLAGHRLDRQTSGVLVLCRGRAVQQRIMDEFKQRRVEKSYIGFCQGAVTPVRGMWRTMLRGAWPYTRQNSKQAITRFQVAERRPLFSVVVFRPETGRTNQLRVQSQQAGYPLLGDRRFSVARQWRMAFPRVALHAWRLQIVHPLTQQQLAVEAAVPEDMLTLLRQQGIDWLALRERLLRQYTEST